MGENFEYVNGVFEVCRYVPVVGGAISVCDGIEQWQQGDRFGAVMSFGAAGLDAIATTKMLSSAKSAVWKLRPFERGFEFDKIGGSNLIHNYPVIDHFDELSGAAKSIKSLDLTAKSYKSVQRLEKTLGSYVDKLDDFKLLMDWGPNKLGDFEITSKTLEVFIPVRGTRAQRTVMSGIKQSAKDRGIKVKFRVYR